MILLQILHTKLQGQTPKPITNFDNIPLLTTFHENKNKIVIKDINRKIENTLSDYLKGICLESNIFLSERQSKTLLRLLSNFSISLNPSLPKGISKCNAKRCKNADSTSYNALNNLN